MIRKIDPKISKQIDELMVSAGYLEYLPEPSEMFVPEFLLKNIRNSKELLIGKKEWNNKHVLICAPRASGKTFAIQRLFKEYKNQNFLHLYNGSIPKPKIKNVDHFTIHPKMSNFANYDYGIVDEFEIFFRLPEDSQYDFLRRCKKCIFIGTPTTNEYEKYIIR